MAVAISAAHCSPALSQAAIGRPVSGGPETTFSHLRWISAEPFDVGILTDCIETSPKLHGDPPAAANPQGLADRNALAAVAFARTRMPMVVTDSRQADNPIVLANDAFLALTGYTADEVIGRNCRFLQGEGTSPVTVAEIREALAAEREIDVEILNYRKDGTAFWNQLSLSPVHDDEGKLLYVFGSQIDVTEYRKVQELEASEHRLLREVDHRARNVLAVVSSIVRLSRADDAARYAASIQQRVKALSEAHSLLARKGWQEIALVEIIEQQIAPTEPAQVRVAGPQVMIPAIAVQPLAMVINELAENAAKHGSLSTPGGQLSVSWTPGSEYGSFTLEWEETGGPTPAPPSLGVGASMIKGLIEKQLSRTVEQQWTQGGLFVAFSIPGFNRQAQTTG